MKEAAGEAKCVFQGLPDKRRRQRFLVQQLGFPYIQSVTQPVRGRHRQLVLRRAAEPRGCEPGPRDRPASHAGLVLRDLRRREHGCVAELANNAQAFVGPAAVLELCLRVHNLEWSAQRHVRLQELIPWVAQYLGPLSIPDANDAFRAGRRPLIGQHLRCREPPGSSQS
jgi:hypothetical protein